MSQLAVIHFGKKSEQARATAAAAERRLEQRHLEDRKIQVYDGPMTLTGDLLDDLITTAWALGAAKSTLDLMRAKRIVPIGVQRMIRNPGLRTDDQKELGAKRIAHMLAERHRRAEKMRVGSDAAHRNIQVALKAASNYRQNPGAYHYLAGGRPNTIILKPTPRDWRSDCSQFAVNIWREAGSNACPGSGTFLYSNTNSISMGGEMTTRPTPGLSLGLYGRRRGNTHHVEFFAGVPGAMLIGHGTAPIDSVTPGQPDFYLTFVA